jgi:outer membrane receptor for ferrienterochelin and colicins
MAPESLGGAIQIKTLPILSNKNIYQFEMASDEQKQLSLLSTKRIDQKNGIMIGLSAGETRPIDLDKNKVSELPAQKSGNMVFKHSYRRPDLFEVSTRVSFSSLESVGGNTQWNKLKGPVSDRAESDDFINSDVRQRFIGDKNKVTDNVNLNRYEFAQNITVPYSDDEMLFFRYGWAFQDLKTIYTHGYDYDNVDELFASGFDYEKINDDESLLRMGLDFKSELMNSDSQKLYRERSPPLQQDDLRTQSLGLKINREAKINPSTHLSTALRADHIRTQWRDLSRTLDRVVLAPRAFLKSIHNSYLTSRASLGIGYRSPLTLFESEHGTDHDGFVLDLKEIETAESAYYSLLAQNEDRFLELGLHFTHIRNMAYAIDSDVDGEPTRFANSKIAYLIQVYDLSFGQRLNSNWEWESTFEVFQYPRGYKAKLPVAAVENRATFISKWEQGNWKSTQKLSVIGERNLSHYNYDRHYNRAYVDLFLPDPVVVTDQKRQKAPTFFTLDLTLDRTLSKNWSAQFSILNVFDYTQNSVNDSPLTWDLHGDHFHLDNFHIWGPLRRRQVFFGLSGQL